MRTITAPVGWLALVIACGCGGTASQSVTPTKSPELKAILNQVAESGNLEDVKETISTQIEKIEETDAAKAKELATDFEVLRKAVTPAQVKEHAKKMATKL